MPLIQPFQALRPAPGRAQEVIAPPYDVLSSDEAREMARAKPWSFLHISKPEIDLAPDVNPYDEAVYAKAVENFSRMLAAGVLRRDERPCYYAYRLIRNSHVKTGLVAVASVAAYNANRIRKHEFTTPVKEDDRVRQIEALNAQTGPVMLAYPDAPEADALIAAQTDCNPDADVTADDGVRHSIWAIRGGEVIARLTQAFERLPALYIADGHHRAAAAARVCGAGAGRSGGASPSYFLAVIFPHNQMRILDYNRAVRGLNGHTPEQLGGRIGERFLVTPSRKPVRPGGPGEFGMYLAGSWRRLAIRPDLIPQDDPIGRLDVSLLQHHLIAPILGISDVRRDKRIEFVGGARGLQELERLVDAGTMSVAFSLYPTRIQDVMAVADAGGVMPPKSTWFEPKLADGLVSHMLD